MGWQRLVGCSEDAWKNTDTIRAEEWKVVWQACWWLVNVRGFIGSGRPKRWRSWPHKSPWWLEGWPMSGRPAGGGASVLGGSHHPPSPGAGRSAALTYGEERQHGLVIALKGSHGSGAWQPQLAPVRWLCPASDHSLTPALPSLSDGASLKKHT